MDNVEKTNEAAAPEQDASVATLTEEKPVSMSDFESYEQSFKTIAPGYYMKGKVVKVDPDGVYVDVGYKTEGKIPSHELVQGDPTGNSVSLSPGDEVDVVVIKVRDQEGELILSKKRADLEIAWKKVIDALDKGEVLTATCIEQVKGGLIVDIGLRGFVPASHVDMRPIRDLSDFVGEALRLKVLEIDRSRRKVVLSRKKVLEEERDNSREATLKSLYEGEIRTGKVARLTDFGAFVNLGGVDGLIHVSELSWRRVKHPSEVVRVGDTVEVLVLKIDPKKERISLSLRQAKADPWLALGEKFRIGDKIEGPVSKIAKNYVFVEVLEGVEGLVPISEISEEKVSRPDEILKVGQKIAAKVLDVKPSERRMILSIRQAEADASKDEYSGYSHKGTSFNVGEILKSKMEAKNLQDIISPKKDKTPLTLELPPAAAPAAEAPPAPAEDVKPAVTQTVVSVANDPELDAMLSDVPVDGTVNGTSVDQIIKDAMTGKLEEEEPKA
ncbi:MAG: 30S ribosomal protein S1 [Candidatus Eremiobacteraeota bacterium]|nr:30S ribosomal protein S1 [Candidatus Eremiobacteraeota bacterium]